MNIWGIMIAVMVLSFIVQYMLQSRFNKYSKVGLPSGMTGAEVAQKMLHDHGIYNVKVIPTKGMLTDHFNPQTMTVALSEGVYASRSVAAAAVAAHECGHAVQHAAQDAFGSCAGRELRIQHRPVDTPSRSPHGKHLPGPSLVRHPAVCDHYLLQLHHPAGRDQRQQQGNLMADTDRNH